MKIPFTGQKSLVIHRLLRIEQPCDEGGNAVIIILFN
jgi:hypothetical protein